MTHPVHHRLQVRATGQQPGRVRVTQVVDPHVEVDTARRDGRQPDPGAEGVAADRGADRGGEQPLVVANAVALDLEGDRVQPLRRTQKVLASLSLG
jgi:hypothetical protein